MSSEIFKVGLSLRSRSLGRAIRTASTRRTIIHPEAIGIVAMAMAGERTGIWGMSIGKIRRGTSKTLIVGDARDHLEQAEMWIKISETLSSAGDEPQIVFSNRQSAKLLTESASRFRYNKNPLVSEAAETVWWCCTRREMAGSHSSVVLTDAICEQYAIGEDGCTTDDLRVALAWVESSGAEDLEENMNRRLEEFSDPKTSLEFDEELWPSVDRRDSERKSRRLLNSESTSEEDMVRAKKDIALQAKNRASVVKKSLTKPLEHAWKRLVVASKVVEDKSLPYLEHMEKFCEADKKSWQREISRREKGYSIARRDSTRAAVVGMAEAGVAAELWEGALVWGDEAARAEALCGGAASRGTVMNSNLDGLSIIVKSGIVKTRLGDSRILTIDGLGEITVEITDVSTEGDNVLIEVEWSGMNIVEDGAEATLWPLRPDFSHRYLGWLSGRIGSKHWVLGDKNGVLPTKRKSLSGNIEDPLALALGLKGKIKP